MRVEVIIGSGFGDEGKGLVTDYIVEKLDDSRILNVRFNGGAQAGHTVYLTDGTRHVFSSIGSGSFRNAAGKTVDTYFSEDFIIEPHKLITELFNLDLYNLELRLKLYADYGCRITTIYDIVLNRAREYTRSNRHGSCGCGIYETIVRDKIIPLRVIDLYNSKEYIKEKLYKIEEYFITEMIKLGYSLKDINEQYIVVGDESKIDSRLSLILQMKSLIVGVENGKELVASYDSVVFEGAQGLMLDMDNKEYMPHLTPSHTGLDNVLHLISDRLEDKDSLNVTYVTRSYSTRHGNGRLDYEVDKSELGDKVDDNINIYNESQGSLRYAKLNFEDINERINNDFKKTSILSCNTAKNLVITHLDQTDDLMKLNTGDMTSSEFMSAYKFDKICRCYGETSKDMRG